MADNPAIREAQILAATRQGAAASLAGGIIAASGRAHSIAEALEVLQACYFSLWAEPGNGRYENWNQRREEELSKVRA